jgi:molybdopterin molybdotransferase
VSHGADRVWSVTEHLESILGQLTPLEPIELPLLDAQGCVLVEDVTVPVALPQFANSSMDGYAVRVADVQAATDEHPAVLDVIGDVAAGSGEPPTVRPGQAARIMTGAPIPPGAEALVPVEWTDGGARAVHPGPGQRRRRRGARAGRRHRTRPAADRPAGRDRPQHRHGTAAPPGRRAVHR